MAENKFISNLFKYTLILSFSIFLVLINLNLLMSESFIEYEYERRDFPKSTIFSDDERLFISGKILNYLYGRDDDILYDLNKEHGIFRDKEIFHLMDVKALVGRLLLIQKISGVIVLSVILLMLMKGYGKDIPLYILISSLITLVIFIILIVSIYLDFDLVFRKFHELFFPSDSWIFHSSDTLIQLFPTSFWFDSGKIFVLMIIIECTLISLTILLIKKEIRKSLIKHIHK